MEHVIASTYEIVREIGSGGGGVVYLARHLRLGKEVVLKADKRKLAASQEDLRREVDTLKTLHHPYIPQVYDFLTVGDTVYTVMDFIEGESLDKALKRGERFSQPQIVQWACQLLEALAYLHSRPPHGILHGDIKPANIMLTPEGEVRLIDFNIALHLGEDGAVAVGRSFGYASPEHYGLDYSRHKSLSANAAEARLDPRTRLQNETFCTPASSLPGSTTGKSAILLSPRSDIYSLGATLYHLMTGQKPARDALEVSPISSEQYSPALIAIIQKAMQPDPALRYQTASEMLAAFYALWDNDPRAVRLRRRKRILLSGCAGLFLVGAFCMGAGFQRMQNRQHAQDLAALSAQQLASGDVDLALETALSAIPDKVDLLTPAPGASVQKSLTDALGVYDLSGGLKLTHTVELETQALKLALSPDGATCAAASLGALTLFSTDTGAPICTLETLNSAQADMAFLDNETLVYAGADGVTAYDIQAQKMLWCGEAAAKIAVCANGASIAAASPDGTHAVVYAPDGTVRRQINFAGRDIQTVTNAVFADPQDMLFSLNAAGDLLAVSFSDGSLTLYDIVAQEDVDVLDAGTYERFEGGFYRQYFAFSATNSASSLFAVIDTQAMEQTGGFELSSRIGVQADESGVYISNDYTLVQIDPVTGEQREMAFTNSVITDFWRSPGYTLVMTQDAGIFLFTADAVEQPYDILRQRENCYAVLWDGGMALATLDSPVVQLLHFSDESERRCFVYDSAYAHDEARINDDETAAMLYSYRGFRLVAPDGSLLASGDFPDASEVYDQQYYRDGGCRLEVIYNDGHIDTYSGDTGEKLETRQGDVPNPDLSETFETTRYHIESPLHGAPQVYDRQSGKLVGELSSDAYLTYVTQVGDDLITEYISEDGTRWGLLLNAQLEPLARLPQLCDVSGQTLYFDDQLGNLRHSRLYSIEELEAIAYQKLEERQ